MVDDHHHDHIRAGFYQAASNVNIVKSATDTALFTHLIFVPSAPLRILKSELHFRDADLRHVSTFADVISPSSTKALLAVLYYPHQPATSSIAIAREHHFHGVHFTLHSINLDFLQFCARWRHAAAQESRLTCRRPLLLTASFSEWSPQLTVPTGVPFPLHWLCLCGRPQAQLHSNNSRFTFSHSALHDWKPYDTLSIHSRLRTCLDAGLDPSLLVLGLAMHGFSFQLKDPSVHGMHAPCILQKTPPNAATHGPVVRQRLTRLSQFGTVAYRDVIEFIGEHKAKYCHDSTTQSAYCYVGATWIDYDDTFTITQKVHYIKSMRLKGYALDSLHEDTSNWHLSNAARSSFLADIESKQIVKASYKGKECKGKQKLQSRATKEIVELGVHLSSK